MSTKNVPRVMEEIGGVVGSIATGARLIAHRGTICACDNPTDPWAGCARCQSDSSRIVSDKAHETDCRSPVPQAVKGVVEQERMQKHLFDATGQRSPGLWMYQRQCDAKYRPSRHFRRLWRLHKCDSLIEKLTNLSLYHETSTIEQDNSVLNKRVAS